ncbi:MAG: hypothetical protein AB7O73_04815 [Bacteroidia bacterium]
MKLFVIIALFLSVGGGDPEKKAKELCNCITSAKDKNEKGKCLELQEKIVKELGEGSEEHKKFKELTNKCLQEHQDKKNGINLSLSYEEKVKATCDCFAKSKGDRKERMNCFMIQDKYGKSFLPDTAMKVKYTKETNSCAD